MAVQTDVKPQIESVFSFANTLRGVYQPDKYKDVIIPMVIIRRLECALEPTRDRVCDAYEKNPNTPPVVLERIAGENMKFYNTCRYRLKTLLGTPASLKKNLRTYIDGFSPNIKEILADLEFDKQIEKMAKGKVLTGIVRKFSELNLDPATVNNVAMGYMFEEIIRRFSENAKAGDHYTPREVVRLLTRLALAEGCEDLDAPGRVVKVADVACGTGGMLACAMDEIKTLHPEAEVYLYGQEVNEESHAICLADMLIKGQRADHIRLANTMMEDCFPGEKMRIELINPPFGQAWGGDDAAEGVEKAVNAESRKVNSRFPWGLPTKGDMQLLFLQHVMYKLDPKVGRACIISNGSPLFSGGTASGESQIRRKLLEKDRIEAIIALPTDLFYNTGIGIYIWVLSMKKRDERQGKVQLIDATGMWEQMHPSLGKKRRYISDEQIDEIVRIYTAFEESEISRILAKDEFIYTEWTIRQPLQRNYMVSDERIDAMCTKPLGTNLHNLERLEMLEAKDPYDRSANQQRDLDTLLAFEPAFERIVHTLRTNVSTKRWFEKNAFARHLREVLGDALIYRDRQTSAQTKAVIDALCEALSETDKTAPLTYSRNGDVILDDSTKDTEIVKKSEDVADYMLREVVPYVPDAHWSFEEDDKHVKTGAEIPFNRFFYKFTAPESSQDLLEEFLELEDELAEVLGELR